MAAVYRSALILSVRETGHLEHLTHIKDPQIARQLDRSYRRLRAMLDQARGHELEKKEAYCHLPAGKRLIALPADFHQLRNLLAQRTTSTELFV